MSEALGNTDDTKDLGDDSLNPETHRLIQEATLASAFAEVVINHEEPEAALAAIVLLLACGTGTS